ncbi:hypothetical protein, partial [Sporomusa malonica]|uniref:hypothetical protein n=1 Tax=Sporomusa malonica TaxID=112901 RepID=UPI001C391B5F
FFLIIHKTDCSEFFCPRMDNPSVLHLTGDGVGDNEHIVNTPVPLTPPVSVDVTLWRNGQQVVTIAASTLAIDLPGYLF